MVAVGLRAVVPEGILVLDGELEDVGSLTGIGFKVETGEDAVAASKRLAWLVEGGLCNGVVLGEEVEFDQIADLGDNVLGLEVKTRVLSGATGEDAVDDTSRADGVGSSGGEAKEGGGKSSDGSVGDHFDFV